MKIKKIFARQILDSRGWPTIECEVELENNQKVKASVPSGASVGKFECLELRDNDPDFYLGRGVLKAVANINKKIAPKLIDKIPDVLEIDKILLEFDGTENKSNLGGNAILAVSMAITRAQAKSSNLELFSLIKKMYKTESIKIPKVMFNILNGGVHANNGICFQEFMIMPLKNSFSENLQIAVVVYQNLKKLLQKSGYATTVGDEGGFAPKFETKNETPEKIALDYLMEAINISKFEPGKDVAICLDVAATQFYDEKNNVYKFYNKKLDSNELVGFYKTLLKDYPIVSIEDGLQQDDWTGWQFMTKEFGDKIQLVGDDIFVTNTARIKKGIDLNAANSVLIKPNQIGTVTETLQAIKVAQEAGYKIVASHRSGETNDSFISDLSVGMNSEYLKAGAPARGERVAKYNKLLEIELNS
ncbi:MAG: phosphopyruvate hydratase [bacterium]